MKRPLMDRLNARSELVTESGCRLWTGAIKSNGYGHMSYMGKWQMVHRLAWFAAHGPIPDGLSVCHRCDVRSCLNVSHLFLGTHQENISDCVRKGRMHYGEKSGQSKLTNKDALAIRADQRLLKEISRDYGVSEATVSLIRNRKSWTLAA